MGRMTLLFVSLVLSPFLAATSGFAAAPLQAKNASRHLCVVVPRGAGLPEQLAAKEIRRYLYLRTNWLVPLAFSDGKLPPTEALIVIGAKDDALVKTLVEADTALADSVASLQSQQYRIKPTEYDGPDCRGGRDWDPLWGVSLC